MSTIQYGLSYSGNSLSYPPRSSRVPTLSDFNTRALDRMVEKAAMWERRGCTEGALMLMDACDLYEQGLFPESRFVEDRASQKASLEARALGVSLI